MIQYKGKHHHLSHLNPCCFIINGISYNSAEQAHQMLQATCAEDHSTKLALASLSDGLEQKRKSKEIKPYTSSFGFK